jgi:hypothetical protein
MLQFDCRRRLDILADDPLAAWSRLVNAREQAIASP